MANKFHKDITGTDLHVIHAYEYANQSARTSAAGLASTDVGKVARQTDEGSFWILASHSPVTWEILTSGSSDLAFEELNNVSETGWTSGLAAVYNGTEWVPESLLKTNAENDPITGHLAFLRNADANVDFLELEKRSSGGTEQAGYGFRIIDSSRNLQLVAFSGSSTTVYGRAFVYDFANAITDMANVRIAGNSDIDNWKLGVTGDVIVRGLTYISGNVGIHQASPSYALDVVGEINASAGLRFNGQSTDARYALSGVSLSGLQDVQQGATWSSGTFVSWDGTYFVPAVASGSSGAPGASTYEDLTNVADAGWTSGTLARYDGTNWVPYRAPSLTDTSAGEPTPNEEWMLRGPQIFLSGTTHFLKQALSGVSGYTWQSLAAGE